MAAFVDTNQRQWQVRISVETVRRVRDLCDVDLLAALEGDLLSRLATDPLLLGRVVYAVCRPQAERDGVSEGDFLDALAGDAIAEATRALLEALADFSRSPQERATLKTVISKLLETMEQATALVAQRVEGGELDQALAAALTAAADSSPSAPASSDSTPDR